MADYQGRNEHSYRDGALMSETFERPDYKKARLDWRMIDDVCAGQRAMKDHDRVQAGANWQTLITTEHGRYIPIPNPTDCSNQNQARYAQYLNRAVFYNVTGHTLTGLLGAAFGEPVMMDLGNLEYLKTDTDGDGVGLGQQVQATTAEVLKKGRHGLWVDYPTIEGEVTVADMDSGLVRATILSIDAQNIINWRTDKIGASQFLTLVVIQEFVEQVGDDGFTIDLQPQIRVLRLANGETEAGDAVRYYSVEIYQDGAMIDSYIPTKADGSYWGNIPFTFVGAQDNNASIDKAPLYDLAAVNIGHYRNSADYEDSCFFVGQAQPWMSGLDEQWRDWLNDQETYIGSRTPILLPENGKFGIEQAQPNTMAKEGMDAKEQAMIALGARLITPGEAVKTATEAQSDTEQEHSILSLVLENVNQAYNTALGWVGEFVGGSSSPILKLNTDFATHHMDAQKLLALLALWQGNALPTSDLMRSLQRSDYIDPEKTPQEILEELESNPPGLDI